MDWDDGGKFNNYSNCMKWILDWTPGMSRLQLYLGPKWVHTHAGDPAPHVRLPDALGRLVLFGWFGTSNFNVAEDVG